jgi:hypothetical protein
MNNPTIELELLESMKSLDARQKSDVLSFVKNISSEETLKRKRRKKALREIKAALRKSRF